MDGDAPELYFAINPDYTIKIDRIGIQAPLANSFQAIYEHYWLNVDSITPVDDSHGHYLALRKFYKNYIGTLAYSESYSDKRDTPVNELVLSVTRYDADASYSIEYRRGNNHVWLYDNDEKFKDWGNLLFSYKIKVF